MGHGSYGALRKDVVNLIDGNALTTMCVPSRGKAFATSFERVTLQVVPMDSCETIRIKTVILAQGRMHESEKTTGAVRGMRKT
jgi:hypothetical protein